jgi:hypothetical protein
MISLNIPKSEWDVNFSIKNKKPDIDQDTGLGFTPFWILFHQQHFFDVDTVPVLEPGKIDSAGQFRRIER